MKKWIFISIALLIVIIASLSTVFFRAVKPLKTAEEKAIAIVHDETSLKDITEVEIYNGDKTYYIVKGKDKKNNNVIAWVPEKGNDIVVRKEKDGISKQQAVSKLLQEENPKEIVSVKLGMLKNKQCWEIYYLSHNNLINYYYVDFKTGEWLRKIENM